MIRGFVAGVLWGGVVAGAGLGVASVMTPLRGEMPVASAEPAAPADDAKAETAVETAGAGTATEAKAPAEATSPEPAPTETAKAETKTQDPGQADPAAQASTEAKPETTTAEGSAAVEPKPEATVPEAEPEGAETKPEAAQNGAASAAAQEPAETGTSAAAVEPSQTPSPAADPAPAGEVANAEAEETPEGQGRLSPATDSLVPAEPEPEVGAEPALPATEETAEAADATAPVEEAPAPALPEAKQTPSADSAENPPKADPVPAQEPASQPTTEAAAEPAAEPKAESKEVLLTPEPKAETPAPTTIVPDPAPAPAATLVPDGKLDDKVDGVTVGRLPSIGSDQPAEAASTDAAADQSSAPLARFAATFENPTAKPLFAILLIDPGTPDLDRATLAALDLPVSFAVDPLAPNAAEAMATYRAGGKEVLILATGIPQGAKASDLEQTFAAYESALPEAVGVLDLGSGGFQDDRGLASDAVALIKAQGRGVITYDRGLNAADQVARREDVPAALVFRSLDDDGEDTPLIRRYLDRAAFKAAQEGKVTVVGTARPETIAALMEWAVEGRASSVALAPASAVLAVD